MHTQILLTILVSFAAALALGHFVIPLLHRLKFGQPIRDDGPQSHLVKSGTPTMGGIFIALAMIVTALIFMDAVSVHLWAVIIGSVALSIIGLIDDLKKVLEKNSKGLRAWQKIVLQLFFGTLAAVYAYCTPEIGSELYIAVWGQCIDRGIWYIPFNVIFMIALTNSVNLTDGLDGLATCVTMLVALFFLLFSTVGSVSDTAVALFAAVLLGGLLGFLIYNWHPAKVFMGDTGSLALGGAVCAMALLLEQPLVLLIVGFVYVMESLSVILQVASFKLTGKRIFKMSPIHHHFEMCGWSETKIVLVFSFITAVLCALVYFLG